MLKNISRFNKDKSDHIKDFIVCFFVTFRLGQHFSFGDNLSITCVLVVSPALKQPTD